MERRGKWWDVEDGQRVIQDGVWERGKAARTEHVSLAKLPTFDLRITVSHNNYSKAKLRSCEKSNS